jgi:hypothetical protein
MRWKMAMKEMDESLVFSHEGEPHMMGEDGEQEEDELEPDLGTGQGEWEEDGPVYNGTKFLAGTGTVPIPVLEF